MSTAFYESEVENQNEIIRLLLIESPIDVNKGTPNRETPLISASKIGNDEIVSVLLENVNIRVNDVTINGRSALFYAFVDSIALKSQHVKVVRLFLRCPATDLTLKDEHDKDAYSYATEDQFKDIKEAFESRGTLKSMGHTCCSDEINAGMHRAAQGGDVSWIKTFVVQNVTTSIICPQVDINSSNGQDFTALCLASREGHSEIVELLLGVSDIDLNYECNFRTALMIAAEKGHEEIVERLLSHPTVDVNKQNSGGEKTALILASEEGQATVVKLLLRSLQGCNSTDM